MRWMLAWTLGLAGCGASDVDKTVAVPGNDAELRDFTGVALASDDRVEIVQGPTFAVRVEGDKAAQDGLNIHRDGDMLKIGRKQGNFWGRGNDGARIRITMPTIATAVLAGAGDISIDRTGEDFSATLSGSGDMTIGQLRGDRAALTVAGTGTIAAAGAVRHLTLSVAGTGDIDARQVKASEARVSIAGTGDVSADIHGPVEVSLVGSGSATLGQDARCVVNRVGTGTADCG
ncbi:head GIN domain-containing protein [Sphingomonas sp. Leaf62]|uniref:head GIN domain-containing protein n=1 Tax=Sphingomonas sp. Leaf62 TaxID=1736228 RepID=UPI0006FF68BC|nr:head GIN domain-containing protein [Sphingomonas sp. Leaf62]KQN81225.1 hypothetical protein ASE91_10325 [Sphingomonas sp. Leaf62]